MTRARKNGNKWEGQFRFGGYWFPVKRRGVVVLYGSAAAARAAAGKTIIPVRPSDRPGSARPAHSAEPVAA